MSEMQYSNEKLLNQTRKLMNASNRAEDAETFEAIEIDLQALWSEMDRRGLSVDALPRWDEV